MINLEVPKKMRVLAEQAHGVASGLFRPIARTYDTKEHAYPVELDMFGAILRGMTEAGGSAGLGAPDKGKGSPKRDDHQAAEGAHEEVLHVEALDGARPNKNGRNMTNMLAMIELCWGDVGLALTIPGQGLGNAAIDAVATPEQKARFKGKWAAMAITEPNAGSDSAAIRASARADGDEYVLNGEKIFVTCGERADLVVVWATLDASLGRAAIKSFVVEKGTPGMRVERLEKKLGIRASDTATIRLDECRVPRANILGSAEIDVKKSFAGAMQTFDNTRPLVAAMALGVARASLELSKKLLAKRGVNVTYQGNPFNKSAVEAELIKLEAELEAAYLLTVRAAWMADNKKPNSMEASMAKAKAGRVGNHVTLRCVELCGALGYGETELLEKWSRDSKILDIFEGTQQIQMLVIARRLLGLGSAELR